MPIIEPGRNVISLSRRLRWVTAAAILLFVSSLSYYIFFYKLVVPTETATAPVLHDVKAPAINRAMITLSNGQKVFLDSAAKGTLAQQGQTDIIKSGNGQIAYSTSTGGGQGEAVLYNTLSNPRGSQVVNLTLSDGTKVWLNAASSLTYPTAFNGKERKVTITGEAYFKVAKNAKQPFIASVGGMEVLALGTEFNISSYSDEDNISATLIEGTVKVSKGTANTILKSGQQTQLSGNGQLTIPKDVNTDEVTGWKEGWFHFESADLKTILRQFARWYDVEVIYEGSVSNRTFFGIVSRNSTLTAVLKILKANDIKFRIDGKKLNVVSG